MKKHGFTIVELLIVIVVIAILAAISIVAYTGIQNNANNSAVQADLRNIAQQFMLYHAEAGFYPSTGAELTAAVNRSNDPHVTVNISLGSYENTHFNFIYCLGAGDANRYAVAARSKSGIAYYVNHQQSSPRVLSDWAVSQAQVCSQADAGTTGQWGLNASGDRYNWTVQ